MNWTICAMFGISRSSCTLSSITSAWQTRLRTCARARSTAAVLTYFHDPGALARAFRHRPISLARVAADPQQRVQIAT
eukprot:6210940-Pleurochrysis_carterae.AAC.2